MHSYSLHNYTYLEDIASYLPVLTPIFSCIIAKVIATCKHLSVVTNDLVQANKFCGR